MILEKMKKRPFVLLAALLAAGAFAVVMGACPQPGSEAGNTDTGALEAKITEAESAKAGVLVSADGADIAVNEYWVTQPVMTAFENAITAAGQALTGDQGAVDAAAGTLGAEITTFMNAKQSGNQISGYTTGELTALIAAALAAKEDVFVDDDAANVPEDEYWVTQDDMDALDAAITAAEEAVSQAEIDAAYVALSAAITAFNEAKQEGTQNSGFTVEEMETLLHHAAEAKEGVQISVDGTDIGTDHVWVTQSEMDALDAAISEAESATGNIDDAYNALHAAIADFIAAKKDGTLSITDYSTLAWGTPFTPLTLGLTPGNDTTEVMLNWYSAGSTAGKVAHVRFIRGTLAAGTELIEKTGGVSTAGTSTAHKVNVTGLVPGASYQYSVSTNGTDWSPMYDFKVPAATGAWRFAAVGDTQLTTGNVDPNSRYPSTSTTTAAGWQETVTKIVAQNVSFIASMGDQVDTATNETQYNNFFAPPGLRNLPFAPSVGNHDTNVVFKYHFNTPNEQFPASTDTAQFGNYYYLYNNVLFVVLNSAGSPGSRSAASAWITRFDDTLKAAKEAHAGKYDWIIVQHHKSTASVADHCADTDIQYYVEAGFETLMSTHGVDFVMAGHDHVYARSYPLEGKAQGAVSVPHKTTPGQSGQTTSNASLTDPGHPIYITLTTGSGLKYYAVSSDLTFNYGRTLYVKTNSNYPYLGEVTDSAGTSSTYRGSTAYMDDKRLPVSNAYYVQPYIPSYTIVDVDGKTISFKTYPIATRNGQGTHTGALPWSFNENTPYDTVTVTKN